MQVNKNWNKKINENQKITKSKELNFKVFSEVDEHPMKNYKLSQFIL